MRNQFIVLLLALGVLTACEDEPPVVIVVPPSETPVDVIDNFYYVQFGWGKPSLGDTVTMEVPDDTLGTDSTAYQWKLKKDFMQTSFDLRHEKIIDTTNAEELDEHLAVGYHYAPATFLYTRGLHEYLREKHPQAPVGLERYLEEELFNPLEEAELEVFKNIFHISFPWKITSDTLPFWDIQDYLDNPSIREDFINWGRVGNNNLIEDTIWNNDAYSGVVLSYIDENHEEWRTDNPPTFQDGSYFVIREKEVNIRDNQTYYIIRGEFSANLYNSRGEYKKAKGGKFQLRILTDVLLGEQPE